MVMKDAFAILRADKQLQSSIHDFALCFQAREFFRLADQGFVNVDVSASHKLIIHQFCWDWCIHAEELITVPDEPVISPCQTCIGYTKRTPLKGMRFESLEEAQAYLDRWEERWADRRIHGTTKRQIAAMFAEEKPHLLPLPLEPFRYYQYGERVVHLDGCVEVEAAYYSLPPGWIGRSVKVQWDALHVRILHPTTNQLLREHLRQKRGGYRIEEEDHPKKMSLSTAQLLRRAAHASTQTGKFCQLLYDRQGETAIRRILGVLSLMKKYGTAAVEDACATALDIGVYEYRFVRRYLERRPHPHLFLRQIDPLIRELTVYRDFINRKSKEQPE